MNFYELKNFNWQAVASLLTAIAVGVALSSIIINNRKARRLEKHLLKEFVSRVGALVFRIKTILELADKNPGQTTFDIDKDLPAPTLKERVKLLCDLFHNQGHMITDKTNYELIEKALENVFLMSEATLVYIDSLKEINFTLHDILNNIIRKKNNQDKERKSKP